MASLNTNVLVSYLLNDKDNEQQTAQGKKLIPTAVLAGDSLYILITVMLELNGCCVRISSSTRRR